MRLTLKIWRQPSPQAAGRLQTYEMRDVSPDVSFLEMLDQLNEQLIAQGEEPVAFDHDCREGICGMCGVMINGQAHGPQNQTTTCQLHMRSFHDGDVILIEPFRADAFPVIKDLVVNRSAFDRIIQSGGFVSVNTGSAPEGNAIPVPRHMQEKAMDAAACIGCGACVASCKNASAMLFTSAKVSQMAYLPQGKAERSQRVLSMVAKMDEEGFGACTNTGECEAACPAGIQLSNIAVMNREYMRALLTSHE
ncbi:succinate dehydrogenase/fumarate reductase iron-sulfur subunit [bacterium]|nr:succinate dehydrogenase/fumarate reductase iron-sulfur subunit [bacterium]